MLLRIQRRAQSSRIVWINWECCNKFTNRHRSGFVHMGRGEGGGHSVIPL